MKKILNKKGFTLIELLAVIVILGVVMAISVASYTTYINNSKKDGFVSSAQSYVNAISDLMLSNDELPSAGKSTVYNLNTVEMYRGGKSPYDNSAYEGFVICENSGNTSAAQYTYYIYMRDDEGNYVAMSSENFGNKKSATRGYVKTGSTAVPTVTKGQTVAFERSDKEENYTSKAIETSK